MDWMVAFETQRGVLEYLGKNPNDRSLIQRKIARGEIVKEDGMYYVKEVGVGPEDICNASTILELKEENEKLKEELKKRTIGGAGMCDQSDLDFQIAENERLEAKVANYQEAIRKCYLWARNVKKDKTPWPEFKKEILKLEEDLPWEDNQ